MRNVSPLQLVFGLLVIVSYVVVEARGTIFGGTDVRPSAAWFSGAGRSGWGYSTGYFGGK